ncbi:MAG: hypothetical protein IPJ74_19435 [Saprospiraceae bacterium]|nr:hypothetical protein [Saprospiraceae bacterium]
MTTMWKATDNVGFGQDIAGIGLDQCTDLHQKQSKSVNSDALITMAVGDSVASSNATNINEVLVDNTFLVWSNNGASTVIDQSVSKMGINSTMRMSRIWKVDKSDEWSDIDITICIPQMGERYLLIDKNSTGFDDDANTVEYRFDFAKSCVTINSSELPDGAYFTLSTKISGPACVDNGIQNWLRADYGTGITTQGGTVSSWIDFSGNANNATGTGDPSYDVTNAINFNPVIYYDGSDAHNLANSVVGNYSIFTISRMEGPDNQRVFQSQTGNVLMGYHAGTEDDLYLNGWLNNSAKAATTDVNMYSLQRTTASNAYEFRGEGNVIKSGTGSQNVTWKMNIGGTLTYNEASRVYVAEVAIYDEDLPAADVQKIESYLAIKYGLTLSTDSDGDNIALETTPINEGDYVDSDGNVIWDASANSTYHNDIAGIGRDDCTELYQKQSKSANSDALVTMALGDEVQPINENNDFTINIDQTFLVWGNNNGSTEFSTALNGTEATARISRVWKVDKSATWEDTEIFICFDNQDDLSFLVVNNTDPNFATIDAEHRLDANGCVNILSSDLPDGAYFTIGRELYGPACVNAGIQAWYRADGGGSSSSEWNDVSNNNQHTTGGTTLAYTGAESDAINFNAGFRFDGNDRYNLPTTTNLGLNGTGNYSVFSVARPYDTGVRTILGRNTSGTNQFVYAYNGGNVQVFVGGGGGTCAPTAPGAGANEVTLGAVVRSSGMATAYTDGLAGSNVTCTANFDADPLSIGYRYNNYFYGVMSEVVVYNRALSNDEVRRVNSYLALKYGVTLDQTTPTDYLASDGVTKMWTAADNSGYGSDIAGIGRDDCTQLNQKQSKSANSDALISMALGATFETDNASNIETINNDKSFLVWSNNNLATTFTESVSLSGIGSTMRTARVWKVDKSSNWSDQDITICISQSGERYLLIDSETDAGDGIFNEVANVTEYVLDVSTGCVTINSADLPDGAYFTLGLKIAGPACVDSGIEMWLRGDYSATGAQWTDYSGNNIKATQATAGSQPTLNTSAINFNPGLSFDGNDFMDFGSNLGITGTNAYTLFSVTLWNSGNGVIGYKDACDGFLYRSDYVGVGVCNNGAASVTSTMATAGLPYTSTVSRSGSNYNLYYNGGGKVTATNATSIPSRNLSLGVHSTGRHNGILAEVIKYNRALTDMEVQQVNSYLSLKYGITLNQSAVSGGTDYLASDGVAYWTADATDTYEHDIAGIGRDSCTDLHQKQSKSVNTDDIVTMALGDEVAASNVANMNTIPTDKSFLVWANNNGNFDFGADATGVNATARMNRVWRVQKTANWEDQTITMCFGSGAYNDTEYLIISNADPLFGTVDIEHQLDGNGCVSFDSGELPDDAYFTLGRALRGPACVNGGVKLWLRADDVAIGNLVNALGWSDYSNNENDFTTVVSDPANISGSLNYNNYVEFDSGDRLDKASISSAFTAGEVFIVQQTAADGGHGFYFGGTANSAWNAVSDDIYENFGSSANRIGWDVNTGTIVDTYTGLMTIPNANIELTNWNLYNVSAATNDWRAYLNGFTSAKISSGITPAFPGANNYIGFGGATYLNGNISEVVLYSRALTDAERQKVQSYLSIKYGITLSGDTDGDGSAFETGAFNEGDYVASNDAVFWDASANSTYHNDIAGIGRDSCTGLLQKQSASINTGSVVRMALGDAFEVDNISNTSTITADRSFLLWGSNGMATTFGTAVDYSTTNMYNSTVRMNRVWKVQKTNWTDQNITLCFNQSGERYLLVDEDGGSFEDDANTKEYSLNFTTGCITFSSSSLPNGATFTLATKITGPACVNTGIQLWLRADYGATGTQWTDFSGNQNTMLSNTGAIGYNTSGINYNPSYTFTSDNFRRDDLLASDGNGTIIFVGFKTVNSGWDTGIGFGVDGDDPLLGTNGSNFSFFQDSENPDPVYSISTIDLNRPYVFGADWINEANAGVGMDMRLDGRAETQVNNVSSVGAEFSIGSQYDNGEYWDGDIAEAIVYDRKISADEYQRVESYLALKYGITLSVPMANADYDYVSYDGSSEVVMWSAVDNFGYHNDIAGIGREDCTELHQRQSKSVNGDDPVTIAMGDAVAATNATNPNDVGTDRTFLVWGNNDGVLDFLDDVEGATNATARLDRIWKVDKSATWQDDGITICFTSTYADQYLLIDNDADFSSVSTEAVLDANGCASISSSALMDGAYFTVGKALMGPACVDGGIRLWLRGDIGVTDASSIISQWNDQSGNGGHVTPVAATKEPLVFTGNATTNYNPSLTFDGVNDELYNTTYDPWSANTDGTVFVSFKSRATNVRKFFSIGADGDDPAFGVDGAAANGLRVFHDASVPTSITSTDAYIDDQSTVGAFTWATGANQGIEIRTNGKSFVNATVDMVTFDPTDMFIGSSDAAEFWLGEINEVVVYNRKLSATEIQKVESYLALKYGTTLDQTTNTDYLASDDSKMWENDNDGFEHDIAGLGKDECTGLHQKQSSSVNADDVVTFAMGDALAATNADNANAVTNDLSFFTWANDNGNTDVFSTMVTAANAELRMARIWKVDKFNWEDQDITICFDGQIGERYLLIDNNSATLASIDQEIALDPLTGCATFSSLELGHGYYFSLGTKILGPGCADNADILTWLRADYGATPAQWNDFSGRTTHATSVNQPVAGSIMNFNPAMDFEGTDFYTFAGLDINYTVTDRDPITVLTIYQPDVTGRGVWGNDNAGFDRFLNTDVVSDGNANAAYSGGNTVGQITLVTSIMDEGAASGSFVFADGQRTLTFTQSGSGGGITGTYLGDNNGTNAANSAFDGRIAEFAVYRGALTDAQRQQAESYLALKYGITLSTDNNGNSTALEVISGSITEGGLCRKRRYNGLLGCKCELDLS